MNRNSSTEEQALRAFTFTHSSNFKGRDRGRGRERGNPANISQSNGDGSKHFKVDDQQFQGFHSTVSFGDCSTVNVMGKGDIKIRTKNGFIETISNVFYVPDLKSNLLSAGQLQEKCYEKSEAFGAFKSFKARMEKETEKTIKTLRTDRGGEYCSKEFDIFCDALGIRRELTIAYTPQQNGVSERKNKTILNMVTSLLTRGKIPKSF
eukprot:XP_015578839.1 uncharacterized protein LOC107261771 [Ricinus communis]